MDNRPLFSIIIPCYNSKPDRINELLNSIYLNNCRDNIEVIISDDRSTNKEYLKSLENFKDLNIKIVPVPDDDNISHCPGNTREYGVREANGEWITFIDHDDLFTEMALDKVKVAIENTGEKLILYSEFIFSYEINNKQVNDIIHSISWMHGKFYNLDNFWKFYDIHFQTNLVSHEDVAVSSKINCVLFRIRNISIDDDDIPVTWMSDNIYIWRYWKDSMTNRLYENNQDYMEYYFKDYLKATIDVYINDYNYLLENNLLSEYNISYHKMIQIDCIIHMYFYIQYFKFKRINDYNLEYEFIVKKYIKDLYKRFDMYSDELFHYIDFRYNERGRWYNEVRFSAKENVGFFIETDSFYDFISK